MSPKRWLLAVAALLGIGSGVVVLVPQAAPLAVPFKAAADFVREHASAMPDDCPDSWCARDAKGACHVCGPVNPRDGGPPCECR